MIKYILTVACTVLELAEEFHKLRMHAVDAGIYYGAMYGGSTTSILMRIPGEAASVVTCIDGYQMAQRGRAGVALATSAIGSFFAGSVATIVLALFAPPLAEIALKFSAPETFALAFFGGLLIVPTYFQEVRGESTTDAGLLMAAAILGDSTNYVIGRTTGERLFRNPNSKIFRRDYLTKTHEFYERHGGKTVTLARFLPIVRTFAPFVAGIGAMTWARFTFFNLIGAFAWVVSLTLAGYFFGNLPWVQKNLSAVILGIIAISMIPVVIGWWQHRKEAAASS